MNEVFREDSRNVASVVEDLLMKEDLIPMYEIDLGGNYKPMRSSKVFLMSNSLSPAEQRVTLKSAVEIVFDRANRRIVEFSRMFEALGVQLPAIYGTDLRWTLMMEDGVGGELVTIASRNTRDDRDRDWQLPLGVGIRGCLMIQMNGAETDFPPEKHQGEKSDKPQSKRRNNIERADGIIGRVARNQINLIHYKELLSPQKEQLFNLDGNQIADTHDIAFYACYPIRVRAAPDRFRCVGIFSIHSDQEHLLPYFVFPGKYDGGKISMPSDESELDVDGKHVDAATSERRNGYEHVYWVSEPVPEIQDPQVTTNENIVDDKKQRQILYLASTLFRDVRRDIEELVLQTINGPT